MLREFEQRARVAPKDPAALGNLGIILSRLGRLEEAEKVLRRALVLAPTNSINRFALGIVLLARGSYAEAWPLYAARTEVAPEGVALQSRLKPPRWSGEPIARKRLLVMPEQGLGDQIQFSRLLPELVAAGAKVILVSHAPLHSLFRVSFAEIDHVVAQRVSDLPEADYWVSLIELPAILQTVPETLPEPPYLRTEASWRNPPATFKTGFMAQGNPRHPNDARRSLSPAQAASLQSRLPGTIVSLDPKVTRAPSFAETAAIIRELDLIVSVDTAAAHLAGAMGKRCLLLLPGFDTDWRWMRDRSDSPWYPKHSLYRSTVEGDWADAIERVVADAHAFAAAARRRSPS